MALIQSKLASFRINTRSQAGLPVGCIVAECKGKLAQPGMKL